MKAILPLLITLFSIGLTQGQDLSLFDVRLGAGSSFVTSGDHRAMTLDGEINYHFSDFLSLGAGLTAGSSSSGNIGTMSFFHQRIGAYLSPIGNHRKIDMRFGVGPAFYRLSEMQIKSAIYVDDVDQLLEEFERINYWTFGMHVSLEATFDLTERIFLGGSIMTHFYEQGDLNHTKLIKLGVRL